jgi:cathepsin B
MVACDYDNYGCNGGFLVNSVDYLLSEGVTTEKCLPYQDHDSKCNFKCKNKSDDYVKYYCKPGTLKLATKPWDIQYELMTNGPMMVGLTVFEDFLSYDKGVYEYLTGGIVGGHAMKLIGWGTDNDGYLYWIC